MNLARDDEPIISLVNAKSCTGWSRAASTGSMATPIPVWAALACTLANQLAGSPADGHGESGAASMVAVRMPPVLEDGIPDLADHLVQFVDGSLDPAACLRVPGQSGGTFQAQPGGEDPPDDRVLQLSGDTVPLPR